MKSDLNSGSRPLAVPDSSKAERRGRKNNGYQEAKETRIVELRQEVSGNMIGSLRSAENSNRRKAYRDYQEERSLVFKPGMGHDDLARFERHEVLDAEFVLHPYGHHFPDTGEYIGPHFNYKNYLTGEQGHITYSSNYDPRNNIIQ